MSIEDIIFSHLLVNEEYNRKVIPFLKNEYFNSRTNKVLFELIDTHVKTYHRIPTKEALLSKLESLNNLTEDEFKTTRDYLETLKADLTTSVDWLCDETEKFCQERSIYNAIMDSIKIIDNKDPKRGKGSIPAILTAALGVSFDTTIGHDFIDDSNSRYDHYHIKEEKLEFDLEYFNKITKGGINKKSLNVILASCVHPDTKVVIRYRKST